ncbi:MAG: glycerophosphodiester phosphodiesterase [Butyricicoccus sp.]|nr:glycerophosphodiester phosphodiesterase [Butyricicoccus sp.]MBQ8585155.1 glycerophosphodiester phosphodiesterase [Butyricicoccus sp.]
MAHKILNLAHRGFSGLYPENSPIAFEAAVEKTNCHGFESDVHLTKDGRVVVMHDPNVDRTSNGTGYIKDMTYEELLQLDIGSWKGEEFAGQHIWTWIELLDFCKQTKKVINLEIKDYEVFYEGLIPQVIREVEQMQMQDMVFLSSFNHLTMEATKRLNPEVKTGLLYDKPINNPEFYFAQTISDNIHPRWCLLQYQPHLEKVFRELGRGINTWTCNTEKDVQDMIDLRVDSIISNYPDMAGKLIDAYNATVE